MSIKKSKNDFHVAKININDKTENLIKETHFNRYIYRLNSPQG